MAVSGRVGLITILGGLCLIAGCSSNPPANLGVRADGTLAPCPASPNCVSSFASPSDKTHYIRPFRAGDGAWKSLQAILRSNPRFRILRDQGHYIHVAARTRLLHFVDDLEFLEQPDKDLIQLRSASRIGYSDFGKNRSRLEALRRQLKQRAN